jgi:uncharacterized membrane protein
MNKISLGVMAILYVVAGINHFLRPEMYVAIMPRFMPESSYRPLVAVSGILEAVLGFMLIRPATRHIAAWGIVILLIVIFPANIQMTIDFSRRHNAYAWLTWLRLPLQALLIWWAFTFTR